MQRILDGGLRTARCTPWELVACVFLLAVLGATVFGSHVANGGFYNDDWAFAVAYRYRDPGLFGAIGAFDWLWFRPVATVYWPLTHAVFGLDPGGHLAWIIVMAVAMSGALYWLLRTLGLERVHAGAIALLVLIFPASDANRLFAATSIALPAITLFLLGAIAALRGLETRGRRALAWHAGAVTLYVLSVMTYEIAAGAILLSIVLYRRRTGWREALPRWAADVAVVGTVLVFITSGSWNKPQSAGTIVRHARVMADQACTVLGRVVMPYGPRHGKIVAGLLGLLVAASVVVWRRRPPGDPVGRALGRWLRTAVAGGFAAAVGYAIFVTADLSYLPLRPGQFNRVNGLAAVGIVILIYAVAMLAGTLVAQRSSHWREWSTAFALAVCLVVGFGWVREIDRHKAQWDRSASEQQDVIASVKHALPKPPDGTTIYTVGALTESAPGVPVFAATWDLAGALQITWDDPSLSAYPAISGTRFVCGRNTISAQNGNSSFTSQQAAYGRAVVVDVATSAAFWINDRTTCEQLAGRFA